MTNNPFGPVDYGAATLAGLSPEAVQATRGWTDAVLWAWVDSVAWVARRDPEIMKTIRGYRFELASGANAADLASDETEKMLRSIAIAQIGEAVWDIAERLLRQGLRDGVLTGVGPDGALATAAHWMPQIGNMDHLLGTPAPQVRLRVEEIRRVWPNQDDASEARGNQAGAVETVEPVKEVVALPNVSNAEVTRWIVERIDAKDTQTNMAKAYPSAFPNRTLCHDRETLREIWRDEFRKRKNELVRPGRQRASD